MENSRGLEGKMFLTNGNSNGNMRDRLKNAENFMENQNEINASVVEDIDQMNLNSAISDSAIRNAINDLSKRMLASIAEASRQNEHRFSLQEGETKRFENQLNLFKNEQDDMIWKVPGIVSRLEAVESELDLPSNS